MIVWTDINFIAPTSSERTGYPAQKPVELYRRIIQASSNPDGVILDYRPPRDYSNPFFASNLDNLVINSGSGLWVFVISNEDNMLYVIKIPKKPRYALVFKDWKIYIATPVHSP